VLFDAGMFIGALLRGDPRHIEARQLVEAARRGPESALAKLAELRFPPPA
jgi:predicted nucleic acid-binding protein